MASKAGTAKSDALEHYAPRSEAPFSREEYHDRLTRIREAMERAGVDCLYLSGPESICYVSGYAAEWYQANSPWEWLPASGIAVHVDHDDFIHFEHVQEETLVALTAVSGDVLLTDAEGVAQQEFIVNELSARGWVDGRVGLEMGCYRPNRLASESFQGLLERSGGTVVDATDIVRGVRRYKSPAERECARRAQVIADLGMKAARDTIAPGVTELEVYGEVVAAMAREGGEVTAVPMPVVSGPRAQTLHAMASTRVIRPNEIVCVDLCGVVNRYHANTARSFAVGECPSTVIEAAQRVYGAVDLVAEMIRPHLPVRTLLSALSDYYREAGILADEWWVGGYELGISFAPDWVGGFMYSMDTDPGDELFLPGEVLNFEANFYLPEQSGIAFCINSMVFDDGSAEFMQKTPSRLEVL